LKEKKGGQWPPFLRWNACTNKYVASSDVQTQEACNKDDNYHYADDVENVHCVLRSRYARFQYESAGACIGTSGPDVTFHHSLKWLTFKDLELPPIKAETPLGIALRPVPRKRVKEWQRTCCRAQCLGKSSGCERYQAIQICLKPLLFNSGTSLGAGCWLPDRSSRRVHRCPKEIRHLPAQ
jgi:hypothetical protein